MHCLSRALTMLCLLVGVSTSTQAQTSDTQDLITIGRAWGLLKYTHPDVTRCDVNWDQALMDSLALAEVSTAADILNPSLQSLLAAAGSVIDGATATPDTPAWLQDQRIAEGIRAQLIAYSQRNVDSQCYVSIDANTGSADFSTDQAEVGSIEGSQGRYARALAAFRYWNAVEHFSPDQVRDQLPDEQWVQALESNLAAILDAESTLDYILALRRLSTERNDGQATFEHPDFAAHIGALPPPFEVKLINGRLIVTETLAQADQVKLGDELIAVDRTPVAEWQAQFDALAHGANPISRASLLSRYVLNGSGVAERNYAFRTTDGSEYDVDLPLNFVFGQSLGSNSGPIWQLIDIETQNCRYGLVDVQRLEDNQLELMLNELRSSDGIIMDARGTSSTSLIRLADLLYAEAPELIRTLTPDLQHPGQLVERVLQFEPQRHQDYSGRLIILTDEQTKGHNEQLIMALQAYGNTLVFGSQTAGSASVAASIQLPGGIQASLSGQAIDYPDGRSSHSYGIVPDRQIYPTRPNISEGRDRLLEQALNCDWISQAPAPRQAEAGIYWNPERNGEGVEIYRIGQQMAVVQFAFDQNGESDWALGASIPQNGAWTNTLSRLEQEIQGTRATTDLGNTSFDFHRGPYSPYCATSDQHALDNLSSFQWQLEGAEGAACLRPLLNSNAAVGFSGAWTIPDDDSGWGLSIYQLANNTLVVALYIYDVNGQPRWLLGATQYQGENEISVPMNRYQGFCRECEPQDLTLSSAGEVVLRLTNPAQDFSAGNRADIHIESNINPAISWQREDIPIRLLTDIR